MLDLSLAKLEFEFDGKTYTLREASSRTVQNYFAELKVNPKTDNSMTEIMSKLVGDCVYVNGSAIGQKQTLDLFTYRQLEKLFVKTLELTGLVKESKESTDPKV